MRKILSQRRWNLTQHPASTTTREASGLNLNQEPVPSKQLKMCWLVDQIARPGALVSGKVTLVTAR